MQDYTSVSRVRTSKRMKRRNMLYTNVCPGSQFKTKLFTSQKEKKKNKNDKEEEKEEGMVTCVLFCFGAVYRLCSLPQNQTELALYSAPSKDFVKQSELASLSLSQCLTPWPSPNPKLLETPTPVNHPPQVIRISKPILHPSSHVLASFSFTLQDTFYSFCLI